MSVRRYNNPFSVQTPEGVEADVITELFVDVFNDFPKVQGEGHTFIHGARGSGKTMMFRYLQPDCQSLVYKQRTRDLPFYAVYVPIKNTDLRLTEMARLESQYADAILNEHLMCLYLTVKTFASIASTCRTDAEFDDSASAAAYLADVFIPVACAAGWLDVRTSIPASDTCDGIMQGIANACDALYRQVLRYLKQLAFRTSLPPYDGPLLGYLDFLHPLLHGLHTLPFLPAGPLYLLIDDADNLSLTQTMVLNSWVSTRTSRDVSIKVSTQLQYKTYRTLYGGTIDSPHDYSEVNISTIYTSALKSKYMDRVREIIQRRLRFVEITATPEEFFPPDEQQEQAIKEIQQEIRANWETSGRGHTVNDDVTRYSRPEFIKRLGGARKSRSTYSYAGFPQLVHVSSGIIRYFLEAASQMFSEQAARNGEQPVKFIEPTIQDTVIKQQSSSLMIAEFERLRREVAQEPEYQRNLVKLSNLITALGAAFHRKLVSDSSERRVFSIAFSDVPDPEVAQIMDLGVQLGYFHISTIGNKQGTGRTPLYVLTRRLAPFFKLDPTSFAGYWFVQNADVREAIYSPNANALLRRASGAGADTYEQRTLPFGE